MCWQARSEAWLVRSCPPWPDLILTFPKLLSEPYYSWPQRMGEEIGEGLLLPSRCWASPNPHRWTKSSPSLCSSAQDMLLLPLSALLLLTQPWRSLGAEMTFYSQKTLANGCTLVMCSPPEGGLPGRDGRDGREGPRGEKGDPGRTGSMDLSWWEGVGTGIVTNPKTLNLLLWKP